MYGEEKKQTVNSLDGAVRSYAQQKLMRMDEQELLASFKEQGVGSMEDLARVLVAHMQAAGRGSVAGVR